jgi:hypothetical protein
VQDGGCHQFIYRERAMKVLLSSIVLFLSVGTVFAQRFTASPDVPATEPNPQFPLHVRILQSHWNHVNGGYQGYGRGDILADEPTGFDYTYSCSEPFLHNAQKDEFYQARWKKQDQKIELLMLQVGSTHEQKCELKVALKPAPYGHYGSAASTPAPAE